MGFDIINILKKEKGLTNAQLAEQSGVTLSTIDKITAGINTNPKLDTLQAICRVLGCTLNDFLDPSIFIKNSTPSTNESVPGDDVLNIFNYLNTGLISLGLIGEDEDITEQQADILISVAKILRASFDKG